MSRDSSLRNLSPVARRLPRLCMKPSNRSTPLARAETFRRPRKRRPLRRQAQNLVPEAALGQVAIACAGGPEARDSPPSALQRGKGTIPQRRFRPWAADGRQRNPRRGYGMLASLRPPEAAAQMHGDAGIPFGTASTIPVYLSQISRLSCCEAAFRSRDSQPANGQASARHPSEGGTKPPSYKPSAGFRCPQKRARSRRRHHPPSAGTFHPVPARRQQAGHRPVPRPRTESR